MSDLFLSMICAPRLNQVVVSTLCDCIEVAEFHSHSRNLCKSYTSSSPVSPISLTSAFQNTCQEFIFIYLIPRMPTQRPTFIPFNIGMHHSSLKQGDPFLVSRGFATGEVQQSYGGPNTSTTYINPVGNSRGARSLAFV